MVKRARVEDESILGRGVENPFPGPENPARPVHGSQPSHQKSALQEDSSDPKRYGQTRSLSDLRSSAQHRQILTWDKVSTPSTRTGPYLLRTIPETITSESGAFYHPLLQTKSVIPKTLGRTPQAHVKLYPTDHRPSNAQHTLRG